MEIVGICSGFGLDTLKTVRSKEVVESRLCIHEGTTTKQLYIKLSYMTSA